MLHALRKHWFYPVFTLHMLLDLAMAIYRTYQFTLGRYFPIGGYYYYYTTVTVFHIGAILV